MGERSITDVEMIGNTIRGIEIEFASLLKYKPELYSFDQNRHQEGSIVERYFSNKMWTDITYSSFLRAGICDYNMVYFYLDDSRKKFFLPAILSLSFNYDWRTEVLYSELSDDLESGESCIARHIHEELPINQKNAALRSIIVLGKLWGH